MRNFKIIVFLTITLQLQAQDLKKQELDSLLLELKNSNSDTSKILIYNDISRYYLYKNSKIGLQYADKSLKLSKKVNWKKGLGISYKNFGMHYISLGKYAEAATYFTVSENQLKNIKDKQFLASLYNQVGILDANKGDFINSLDYFFKSLQLYESKKIKNQKLLAALYENIATVYNFSNEYEKAIFNYKKAIIAYKKSKFREVETAQVITNLGSVYQKKGLLNEALQQYNLANEILKIHKSDFAMGFNLSWIGSALLEQNKFKISIKKSKSAIAFVEKTGDKELLATTLQNLGNSYLKKGISENNDLDIENSFSNLKKAEEIHLQLNNQEGLIKDYLYLSNYYEARKLPIKSLNYHKKYSFTKDLVFNKKNKQTLETLENKREISLRDKEIKINKLSLEAKEKQKYFLIFGLFLLCIIGSLLYYQSRNRRKINQKLQLLNSELDESNKAKTRFFSILNHDLRGPVANLISFLQLQKESPEMLDEESTKRMQDKTMTGAENLLNAMENILQWSKSQMENFKPQLKKVSIDSLFNDIKIHFASEEKVQILYENKDDILINTDENYLKTIIRNLTGNAIKALNEIENPTIVWKAYKIDSQKFLSISDNGFGASQEQFKALYDDKEVVGIQSGLGLHLIRDLAKAINCEINVESNVAKGTTFILKMF